MEIPIIKKNYRKSKALNQFLKTNCTALIYGMFDREKLINCIPRANFDWLDSYIIANFIYKYGYTTFSSEPKFFYGIDGEYKPKPLNGKLIKSFKYFIRALPFAIYAGPVGFIYHLNTIRVAYKLNKILKMKIHE